MNINNINDRIKKLREEKGITQNKLAEDLNVRQQTIAQWEMGERALKAEAIIALSEYFNVTSDYLLGISDNKNYENAAIGKELGLSDIAIENLKSFPKGSIFSGKKIIDVIAQSDSLRPIIHELSLMLSAYITKPKTDDWAVCEYRATKNFCSVIDALKEKYYNDINDKFQGLGTEKEKEEFKKWLLEQADFKYFFDGYYYSYDHKNDIFD